MKVTPRSLVEARPPRSKRLLLPALVAPLILLAACGSDQASGNPDTPGHSAQSASATIVRDGVTVTISPVSGPLGTAVNVQLSGMPAGTMAPFGLVTFKDSTGAFGEDELTTDYVIDPRTLAAGGSKTVTYRIPANVLVLESPGAQNPTKKAPTSTGRGYIVFTNATATVEVPFTVVQR